MKRYLPLFLATLLLSTVVRAQTAAPAGENPPPSSPATSATPSEAAPAPQAEPVTGSSAATPPTAPAEAPAQAPAPVKPDKLKGLPTVAVLALEANKAAQDSAPAIASLLASRIAESPKLKVLTQRDIETILSTDRQRQLLGPGSCSAEGSCLQELSDVVGARYVITGRLDQFGDQYLLTASLLDTFNGRSLARPRAEASSSEELLQVADAVGEQLLSYLVPEGNSAAPRPLLGSAREAPGGGLVLGLRITNSFISNLEALNPGADLEVGYAFHPEWVGFLQVGINFIRSTEPGQEGRLKVVPSVLGARHYYRLEDSLRPYWGLGLGVQLSFGQFGIFQSTGPLPKVVGFFGAEYFIAGSVGIHIELGANLAQAVLGLTQDGLGDGLNLDLTAGLAYHF